MTSAKHTQYVDISEHGEFEEAGHGVVKNFKYVPHGMYFLYIFPYKYEFSKRDVP